MSTTLKSMTALVVAVALAVAVWLIRPLFVDTEVDEAFPVSAAASETPAAATEDVTAFPLSVWAEIPDDMTQQEVETQMVAAAGQPDVEEVEDMPAAEPQAVNTGTFVGADSAHQGEGDAAIYELAEGNRVLRLQNFEVTNGPDLRVYLAPLDADGQPDLHEGAANLGRLKGNIGNQNYDIPADFDIDQDLAVVIYCQAFHVTFATAAFA